MEYFLSEINKLQFDTEPPYDKIHSKLTDCLKALSHTGVDNFRLFKSGPVTKTPSKVNTFKIAQYTPTTASAFPDDNDSSTSCCPVAPASARKKRQATKQIEYETVEEIDESIEELKPEVISAKILPVEQAKTPQVKPKRVVKSRKNSENEENEQTSSLQTNELSTIESYENEDIGNAKSECILFGVYI